jgi:hypothetical protein
MPAIITTKLRRIIAREFFDKFTDATNNYYIGIGRSEQWDSSDTVPTPVDTPEEVEDLRRQLQAIKKVTNTSLVVPRNNWSTGTIYSQYDDKAAGYPANPYYVKTDNNQVYVCLEVGRDALGVIQPSTSEPTGANLHSYRAADGYVWKFLYTISAADANDFMSANYMPVKFQGVTDSNSTGIATRHRSVQDVAVAGEILSIIVTDGGTGYTSVPTVTISSTSGTSAAATAFIDSSTGVVSKIEMNPDSSTIDHGIGYTTATVTLSGGGGTGATARAVIGPDSGIGADARETLKASSIMFHTKLEGTDSDLILDQDFRQVSLIENPREHDGSLITDATANALDFMTLSSVVTTFTKDKIIQGQTSLAKAYVDNFDSDKIYYHQTDTTGFLAFQDGEVVQETNGTGDGVIDSALKDAQVDVDAGNILYIDNRAAVLRDATQSEDVKIIIQF